MESVIVKRQRMPKKISVAMTLASVLLMAFAAAPVAASGNRYSQISVGGDHTCALTTRGEAYCWGDNGDGQLGDGTMSDSDDAGPQKVIGGLRFKMISAGDEHTCALSTRGEAYCWGENSYGEVGDGTTTHTDLAGPQRVVGGLRFAYIVAADQYTCALTTDARAYCWGDNSYGELGDGTIDDSDNAGPQAVIGGHRFSAISAQEDFTCALTTRGEAYCWGHNLYDGNSQLGDGTEADSNEAGPQAVIGGLRFTAIQVGSDGACGLTSRGEAYCWGEGTNGMRGDGLTTDDLLGDLIGGPVKVIGGLRFAKFPATSGEDHRCALTTRGEAYCWGSNYYGQIGDGSGTEEATPELVAAGPRKVIGGLRFSSISVHEDATCGITTRGAAYCWGGNADGMLGDGTQDASEENGPQLVK